MIMMENNFIIYLCILSLTPLETVCIFAYYVSTIFTNVIKLIQPLHLPIEKYPASCFIDHIEALA